MKIGINGFGRIGRLVLRILWQSKDIEITHINETGGDYLNDSRSSIIDGLSTMVVNSNLLKVYAWYDNEWGYSCRLADLTSFVIEKEKNF